MTEFIVPNWVGITLIIAGFLNICGIYKVFWTPTPLSPGWRKLFALVDAVYGLALLLVLIPQIK